MPYGRVVQAMDLAKGAGVERIGIISDKMIEEAGGTPADSPSPGGFRGRECPRRAVPESPLASSRVRPSWGPIELAGDGYEPAPMRSGLCP